MYVINSIHHYFPDIAFPILFVYIIPNLSFESRSQIAELGSLLLVFIYLTRMISYLCFISSANGTNFYIYTRAFGPRYGGKLPLTIETKKKKKKKNGCGPIAGNHWLNYVTPSLLGLRRYPIGPLIARTPNWLGANGSHHTTWENPKRKTH